MIKLKIFWIRFYCSWGMLFVIIALPFCTAFSPFDNLKSITWLAKISARIVQKLDKYEKL
jgi:hypothetical protein